MSENLRNGRGPSSPAKVVQSSHRLQLFSLLIIVAACLSGEAHARRESQVNSHQNKQSEQKRLQQESTYGGYYVPEQAWSTTEDYGKFNSFVIGAKFSETYDFSDECINNVANSIDSNAYYKNNKTQHAQAMNNGTKGSYFEPYLNITGTISGPIADSLPSCYSFLFSIYTVEDARFKSFNQNWGDFFLAFLFNQMGHALTFQSKFKRIEEMKERQNYNGVWTEYGDLIYIIWTFSPIDDSAMDDMRGYVERWFEDHEWLADDTPEEYKNLAKAIVTTAARLTHSWGNSFGQKFHEQKSLFASKVREYKEYAKQAIIPQKEEPQVGEKPQVGAKPTGFTAATDYLNGFFEGLVDVFPFESNPQRCRNNFTISYDAFDRLFLDGTYDWKNGWGEDAFNEGIITDLSYLLKLPFGASYSCYWGFSSVVIQPDPYADGVLTEDEELELLIKLGSHVLTNVFFNAGYLYADSFAIWDLVTNTPDITLWYQKLGIYSGDILIRFFWRRRFTRNFDYD